MPYINVFENDPGKYGWYLAESVYDGGSIRFVTSELLEQLEVLEAHYNNRRDILQQLKDNNNVRECPKCKYIGVSLTCPRCIVATEDW